TRKLICTLGSLIFAKRVSDAIIRALHYIRYVLLPEFLMRRGVREPEDCLLCAFASGAPVDPSRSPGRQRCAMAATPLVWKCAPRMVPSLSSIAAPAATGLGTH